MDTIGISSRPSYDSAATSSATGSGSAGQGNIFATFFNQSGQGLNLQTDSLGWQLPLPASTLPAETPPPPPPESESDTGASEADATDTGTDTDTDTDTDTSATANAPSGSGSSSADTPASAVRSDRTDKHRRSSVVDRGSTTTAQGSQANPTDTAGQTANPTASATEAAAAAGGKVAADGQDDASGKDGKDSKDAKTSPTDADALLLLSGMMAQATPQARPMLGTGGSASTGAGTGTGTGAASAKAGTGKSGVGVADPKTKAASGPVDPQAKTAASGPTDPASAKTSPQKATATGDGTNSGSPLDPTLSASGDDTTTGTDPASASVSDTSAAATKSFVATLNGANHAGGLGPAGAAALRAAADLVPQVPSATPAQPLAGTGGGGGSGAGTGTGSDGSGAGGAQNGVAQGSGVDGLAAGADGLRTADGQDFASQLASVRGGRPGLPAGATEQVTAQFQRQIKDGGGSITMQLRPEELGRVDVHLDIDKDGTVTAMITADRPQTLELLQRDSHTLEQALQNAGLQTDSGSLNFGLRGEGGQGFNQAGDQGNNGTNGNGSRRGVRGVAGSGGSTATDARVVLRSYQVTPGRVDVRI